MVQHQWLITKVMETYDLSTQGDYDEMSLLQTEWSKPALYINVAQQSDKIESRHGLLLLYQEKMGVQSIIRKIP